MTNKNWLFTFASMSLVLVLISGCSSSAQTGEKPAADQADSTSTSKVAPSNTPLPPTPTVPTSTPSPLPPTATATFTALPSDTPIPTATATDTPMPPTPSGSDAIYIYLVQTGTGGPVACGDSLIKVNTGAWRTGDNATDMKYALSRLLVKSKYMVGLYNPVYLSNLSVVDVQFIPNTGETYVDLTGSYVRSGDRCDDGRVHDQIWTTIRQFPGVKGNPVVRVNGNLLGDILSTAPGRESPHKTKKP